MDFKSAVIDKSFEKPVLVDFWAPWCAPCQSLGPVLEETAQEQSELWSLVKVNTEEDQDLASTYGIRSIPNVKLFHKGEIIQEFSGALTKHALLQWLDTHLPKADEESFQELLLSLSSMDTIHQIQKLEEFAEQNPTHQRSRIELAFLLMVSDPDKAHGTIKSFVPSDKFQEAVADILELHRLRSYYAGQTEIDKLLLGASEAFAGSENEVLIKSLIQVVSIDSHYANDLARKSAIALFRFWGNEHELYKKYRKRFDMAIW
jgi:putative thioredoxin